MNGGGPRILIVDDEASLREALVGGLGQAGYDCTTAGNADEAADQLERDEYDLVLLDVMMPGKTGLDFLPEITARHPEVAVIVLTGASDVSTAVSAMRDGAYDYATKPFALPELIIRVNNALARRTLLLENREYQVKLERVVNELSLRQEARGRELTALNSLFQSHVSQGTEAAEAYAVLQEALASFSSKVERLATMAGIIGPEAEETPPGEAK